MRKPWENLTKEKVNAILKKEIKFAILFAISSFMFNLKNLKVGTMLFLGLEILHCWPKYTRWGNGIIFGKDENGNVRKITFSNITLKGILLLIPLSILGTIILLSGVFFLGCGNLFSGVTGILIVGYFYCIIRLWIWRTKHETPEQRMMRKIYEKIGKDKK